MCIYHYMKINKNLLCILSIVAACDHLMISYVLDVITGQIKGRLMDMVQEKNDEKL